MDAAVAAQREIKLDITITSAAIATLISVLTSTTVTLILSRQNRKRILDDQLDGILKIGVQYPYLESKHFTETWSSNYDKNDESYLRYEVYCTMVFNFLARLSSFYKFNVTKIENHIAIKPWVRIHRNYWYDPTEAYDNVDSYDEKFSQLIESYLKGAGQK